jgi:hypothetical protein
MKDGRPFFVGYLPLAKGLRGFLLAAAVFFVALCAGFGLALGTVQDDPRPGAFRFDLGRQTVTGVVEMTPYPVLRVTAGNALISAGDTLGEGKNGALDRARPLQGQLAQASGILLERGDLRMLQLNGGDRGLSAADSAAPSFDTLPLGRWKLAGEICDGKCLAGAMRPGRGIAHKACANLCLLGDVPPVFVSSQPVDGEALLLITGPGDALLPPEAYDHVAQ